MPFQSAEQFLDDVIINEFFTLLPGIAKSIKFSLLCFDTHFCESLLTRGFVSIGYKKWATRNTVWDYPVWLIPVNFAVHWTILIVIHSRQSIVYLDSLHGNPNEKILNGICNFIQENISMSLWDEWTLYTPRDIPSQIINNDVGGNCEMHVCTWAYIIASGSYTKFSEDDMSAARKGI
ncbi:Sentrin-specific protease 1 [Cyphomyrmex costatus]|uniref:Sentrin-specific protease 1 n=1 Tax=Cyphomyrmex costatus TaxID=456900 RepID=A0A151IEY9_9HYME|nr:Sentrin-specific protease 1 [Cyphomyrmex costatus]